MVKILFLLIFKLHNLKQINKDKNTDKFENIIETIFNKFGLSPNIKEKKQVISIGIRFKV